MTNDEVLSEEQAAELIFGSSDPQPLRRMRELGVGPAHVVLEHKFSKLELVRHLESYSQGDDDYRRLQKLQTLRVEFLTGKEAGEALGRGEAGVTHLRISGHLKGTPAKFGYRREDLERFLIPQVSCEAQVALARLRGIGAEAETPAPDAKPGMLRRLAGVLA